MTNVTDAELRDPDAGYEPPGGCPGDAGSAQVVAEALDLGAWLVGLALAGDSTSPEPQLLDLAERTGSLADAQPAPHTQVKLTDWPLTFTVAWTGSLAPAQDPQQVEVTFDLIGDGAIIGSAVVTVEVPPS